MGLMIIIGIAVALFLLAFITKRRFGALGLGLAGGVVISQLWTTTLAGLLNAQNISVSPLSYSTVAQLACILVPPLLLLIAGPKYHDKKRALLGSLLFTVFAALFIVGPITRDFAVAGDNSPVLTFINEWQNTLVGLGVVLAVFDTLLGHKVKSAHKKH